MRHVLWGARGMRVCTIVGIMLAFAIASTNAFAAVATSAGSGGAACSNNALTNQGSCTFSGSGSGTFSGSFTNPIPTADQSLCGTATSDPTDFFCGHFGLNFNNVQGTVSVTINFNAQNDFDLCIADATTGAVLTDANGNPVCSTQTGTNFETLTFTVTCGQAPLEAQVIPFSFAFPGPPIVDTSFTGTVSTNLTVCTTGGTGGGGGGTQSAAGGHKVTGGGQLTVTTQADTNFSVNAIQTGTDGANGGPAKGKVRISTASCDFRGIVDSAEWDDTTQTAYVHGHQASDSTVLFNATVHDGGEGNSNPNDTFTIDKCNNGGPVANGNVQYHRPA